MDLLDGVDFKKGCYVGQEVVSRMQHRGTARRRPVIVSGLPDGAALVRRCSWASARSAKSASTVDGKAVAMVRLDRVDGWRRGDAWRAAGDARPPGWATYPFGESAAAE